MPEQSPSSSPASGQALPIAAESIQPEDAPMADLHVPFQRYKLPNWAETLLPPRDREVLQHLSREVYEDVVRGLRIARGANGQDIGTRQSLHERPVAGDASKSQAIEDRAADKDTLDMYHSTTAVNQESEKSEGTTSLNTDTACRMSQQDHATQLHEEPPIEIQTKPEHVHEHGATEPEIPTAEKVHQTRNDSISAANDKDEDRPPETAVNKGGDALDGGMAPTAVSDAPQQVKSGKKGPKSKMRVFPQAKANPEPTQDIRIPDHVFDAMKRLVDLGEKGLLVGDDAVVSSHTSNSYENLCSIERVVVHNAFGDMLGDRQNQRKANPHLCPAFNWQMFQEIVCSQLVDQGHNSPAITQPHSGCSPQHEALCSCCIEELETNMETAEHKHNFGDAISIVHGQTSDEALLNNASPDTKLADYELPEYVFDGLHRIHDLNVRLSLEYPLLDRSFISQELFEITKDWTSDEKKTLSEVMNERTDKAEASLNFISLNPEKLAQQTFEVAAVAKQFVDVMNRKVTRTRKSGHANALAKDDVSEDNKLARAVSEATAAFGVDDGEHAPAGLDAVTQGAIIVAGCQVPHTTPEMEALRRRYSNGDRTLSLSQFREAITNLRSGWTGLEHIAYEVVMGRGRRASTYRYPHRIQKDLRLTDMFLLEWDMAEIKWVTQMARESTDLSMPEAHRLMMKEIPSSEQDMIYTYVYQHRLAMAKHPRDWAPLAPTFRNWAGREPGAGT